jgi:hypothetical protein
MFCPGPTQSALFDVGGDSYSVVLTASHHDLFQNVDAFWFRKALEIWKMFEVEGPL